MCSSHVSPAREHGLIPSERVDTLLQKKRSAAAALYVAPCGAFFFPAEYTIPTPTSSTKVNGKNLGPEYYKNP